MPPWATLSHLMQFPERVSFTSTRVTSDPTLTESVYDTVTGKLFTTPQVLTCKTWGHFVFLFGTLCFLPQAFSWACGIGPILTLCSPPSALSQAGHPLSRTLTHSLSPAPLLLGDKGGTGGRGSTAEASLPWGGGLHTPIAWG